MNSDVEIPEGLTGNLIALTRDNLHELEAIERLATALGSDRFCALALQLAYEFPVRIEEPYLSIRRMHHCSVIGMSDAPFEALSVVCEVLVNRFPELQHIPSYRYRHESQTSVPQVLWLAVLERANRDMFQIDSV